MNNHATFSMDTEIIPQNMGETLEMDDTLAALQLLSKHSSGRAQQLSDSLASHLANLTMDIPEFKSPSGASNPLMRSTACADSILNSLTKIASGGSQTSQEIGQLEQEKRELEQDAQAVETALILRKNSDIAAMNISSQKYDVAAEAVSKFLELMKWDRLTDRAKAYAGEYTIQQLENAHRNLRETLLGKYEHAVQKSDLQTLGKLTPLLQQIELEEEAVGLYIRYLQTITSDGMSNNNNANASPPPSHTLMARVYNCAVAVLRHHLPMVSHCLHKAKGDAAVIQLIHFQVEKFAIPLFQQYARDRNLQSVARNAHHVYDILEDRYAGGTDSLVNDGANDDEDAAGSGNDCGFSVEVGSMADVDAAMEEVALCLQHAESYTRFIQHTAREVNKARELRFKARQQSLRMERERQEWATGMSKSQQPVEEEEAVYEALEIFPVRTELDEIVAEVGGYYSGIERCLLLASMQRAFGISEHDSGYCRPLSLQGRSSTVGSRAVQTEIVETCLYAAKRSVQRAFATGHTGTSSAMANFCSDNLGSILMQVMIQRVEQFGVSKLKPGEGLLVGSAGIFNASNLIRQGTNVGSVVVGGQTIDESTRRRKTQQQIATVCATFNDMEVAVNHIQQLESILLDLINRGFPPGVHETEHLRMCVKSLTNVMEGFEAASNGAIDSLVSTLKPRIRSIVGEAVGSEGGSASAFMSSSVIGGGKAVDRTTVRMDYNLDEETYQILQLSEGYITRLCYLIDELVEPLQPYLAPRLWDALFIGVLGVTAKRLETSLRKCQFTALGALTLDSDVRDILSFAKERLDSPELNSNVALYKACLPLSRLLQISKLLSVDDLDDVVDLISSSKRKGNWDLKLEDAKAFLSLRVEFVESKVNQLLRIDVR